MGKCVKIINGKPCGHETVPAESNYCEEHDPAKSHMAGGARKGFLNSDLSESGRRYYHMPDFTGFKGPK